jgi:hypothetical protein
MHNFHRSLDRIPSNSDGTVNRNEEETLVADDRAALTPSQIVEQKLIAQLHTSPLLVSQMQRLLKPRPLASENPKIQVTNIESY